MKKMNKKGFVGDSITWGVGLVILIFLVVVFGKMLQENNDSIQESDMPEAGKAMFSKTNSKWATGWDNAIALFIGLMFIVTFIVAWRIGTDSAFFWITLIVLISCLGALVGLNNALVNFYNNDTFLLIKAQMPFTSFIVDHFMLIMIGGASMLMIVLFAKMRSEQ